MSRRNILAAGGGAVFAGGLGALSWRLSVGSMAEYESYAARLRAELTPDLQGIIRHATLAANSHNTQPWLFHLETNAIEIRPDYSRRTPAVDPDDHHLFVSLGCAAANLELAAKAGGKPGEVSLMPDGRGLRFDYVDGTPRSDELSAAIVRRQSTRAEYEARAFSTADLAILEQAGKFPGVTLVLVTDRPRIASVRDLVLAGNADQMNDPAFMSELKAWLRFNPKSAIATGNGLFAASSGNPSLPSVLGDLAFDNFFTLETENAKYARQIESSAGLAIFVGDKEDPDHWRRVGRACQRFALAATSLGLKLAFINQPVEVTRLRAELAALIGEHRRPDIVLRFGYGPTLPFSPRRPVSMVLGRNSPLAPN